MTINERVGNNIRKYRIAHHYTLKDLSALVHKSYSTLSKYEKRILPVSVETLEEFGEVFHIPTSHLLSAPSEGKPDVSRKSLLKKYYMYNYDGRRKRIMKSIIEEYATDQPDTYSIQLFYDVDDLEHFGKCEVIYSGESTTFGPWQNYSLKNTANTLEEIWMCTVNTFSQTDLKSGILSGISQLTMRPCSRKILITSQIQKENHFIDDLLLSKEDIQQIKKYNLFTLGE